MSKYKFGYEDSDKSVEVEIYDLVFKINDLSRQDIEKVREKKDDDDSLDEFFEMMLGKDAIKKINDKRKKDGYPEMDIKIKAGVIAFVFDTYMTAVSDNVDKIFDKLNNKVNYLNNYNVNREQRRNNRYRNRRRY